MEPETRTGFEIAVIGIAGRFPGAPGIRQFWQNLENGVESISFITDAELEEKKINPRLLENSAYVRSKGGELENKEYFDAAFFGYTPREAEIMDPQLRHFHECAWETLEDAGYDSETYDGLIGLYASASPSFYWKSLSLLSGRTAQMGNFAARFLTDDGFIGTKISHKLNLKGGSSNISTACSSSLVAIHMGCRALLTGECDMVLAGGVSIWAEENMGYFYQEGMIMSPDGHCRAFDARARGTVGGEGVGLVLLKPLEDALEHGDHIHAVIKSSAINNDGNRKVGYTAPSIEGQAEVIRTAHRIAGVTPESITLLETHGTGTELGDPVEVSALKMAFTSDKRGFCAIGSVKSNIGHLDHAAGIAGFIKTIMALKHRTIPPTLHFERPNPKIDFIDSPFYISRSASPWENGNHPLRAGVSSFGIGGTNAHAVLEEAPRPTTRGSEVENTGSGETAILLSARSGESLDRAAGNLADHLQEHSHLDLADVAYTLAVGRRAFKHRRMIVCSDIPEAVQSLSASRQKSAYDAVCKEENKKIIFMFPCLDSFAAAPALKGYREEPEPALRSKIKQYTAVLETLLQNNENQIQQSQQNRLSGFILQYTFARLLMDWGIKPHAMIGTGSGEYSAACISGVFSLEDALKTIMLTGTGGQAYETMKHISLNKPRIPYISGRSGQWIAVDDAVDPGYWLSRFQDTGRLPVGVRELLKEEHAAFVELGPAGPLSEQLEHHPDKKEDHSILPAVTLTETEKDTRETLLTRIGHMWLAGVPVNWQAVYEGQKRNRVPLPTYPFERQPYWLEGNPFELGARLMQGRSLVEKKPDIADWFYEPSWRRAELLCPRNAAKPETSHWLIFNDDTGLGTRLVRQLKELGQEVIVVKRGPAFARTTETGVSYSINPARSRDYDVLFKTLHDSGTIPTRILHMWCVTGESTGDEAVGSETVDKTLDDGFYSLLYTVQALGKRDFDHRFHLSIISDNMQDVTGRETLQPGKAAIVAAVKVIPQEYANIRCTSIDILLPAGESPAYDRLCAQLTGEFFADTTDMVVALRDNYRWVQVFDAVRLEAEQEGGTGISRLKEKGVYLVTGGLGGIGLELAGYLAASVNACLVLTGRTALPTREEWDQWLESHEEKDRVSLKIRKVQALEKSGAEVLVCKADTTDPVEMKTAVTTALERFGRIDGVIHSAGLPDGCVIPLRTKEDTDLILAPKVTGTLVLGQVLSGMDLDFFVICSSLSSVVALFGQVGYCAANAFQDAFARLRSSRSGTFTVAINWDLWKEVGMGVETIDQLEEEENIKNARALLSNGMLNNEGIEVFKRVLRYSLPQVVISTSDLDHKIREQNSVDLSEPVQILNVESYQGTAHPRPELSTEYAAPVSDFEIAFAAILKEFFGYDQVGIDDNFFEFGVTSLTIIRINNLLREKLDKKIPIVLMFEYPTIRSLGRYLENEEIGGGLEDDELYRMDDLEESEVLLHDSIDLLREDV
jgi:acyl transferase domain-containing protein/acyl carrier protein